MARTSSIRTSALLVFACLQIGIPTASAKTISELLVECKPVLGEHVNAEELANAGVCAGYIQGVIEGWDARSEIKKPATFCMPDNVTNEQVIRLFIEAYKEKPQYLHLPSAVAIPIVMAQTFPCK